MNTPQCAAGLVGSMAPEISFLTEDEEIALGHQMMLGWQIRPGMRVRHVDSLWWRTLAVTKRDDTRPEMTHFWESSFAYNNGEDPSDWFFDLDNVLVWS